MHMKTLGLLATFGICLLPAVSNAGSVQSIYVGGWSGGPKFTENGQFSNCTVKANYASGITMYIVLYSNYNFAIGFANPSWEMAKGEKFITQYWVDRKAVRTSEATAILKDMAYLDVEDTNSFFQEMRRGYTLFVRGAGQDFTFDLKDTSSALNQLKGCVDTAVAMNSSDSVSDNGGESKTGRQAQSIVLVANLLSQAGLVGFNIIDPLKYKSLGLELYDVVWEGEQVLGGLQIYEREKYQDVSSISNQIAFSDSQACNGQFVSARRADDNSQKLGMVKLMTGCDSLKAQRFLYTIYDGGSRGYLVFTHMPLDGTSQEKSPQSNPDNKMKNARAEAAENSIIRYIPVVFQVQ